MSDNVSKIKDKLDIVDVISGYIKVQKAGVNYKARCPFHNEKTPSFYISPERQIWHCFGCSKGGDMFKFIQELEGIEFLEALRILAARAGVELGSFDPTLKNAKTILYEICDTSAKFFEKQMYHSNRGKEALAYLKERGLTDKSIKNFRLGFAPNDWGSLSRFLIDSGYKEKDIINSGMALKKKEGGMYDRFRSRITFPVFDANNQMVGFSGRIFTLPSEISSKEGEGAKYINTPQTLIYDKSRVLYGFNNAKLEVRKSDRCVVVEGNTDVIMSHQAGVRNVVASSGTALTPEHIKMLKRYTNNLDFCFDSDSAGEIATKRAVGIALAQNISVKVIEMNESDCKDPADYVKKHGREWEKKVSSSKPVLDFYFDKSKSEFNLSSSEGKKSLIAVMAPFVKRLASNVERFHWISRLASMVRANEEAVKADIQLAKDDLSIYDQGVHNDRMMEPADVIKSTQDSNGSSNQGIQKDILNQALLSVIIKNPSLFDGKLARINEQLLNSKNLEIVKTLSSSQLNKFSFNEFIKNFSGPMSLELEFMYLKAQELFKDLDDSDLEKEYLRIINRLELVHVNDQMTSLQFDIQEAGTVNDRSKYISLLSKYSRLAKKKVQLQEI